MLNILLLSLSTQYTVDGQYIPSLFIEPEVRHNKTSGESYKPRGRYKTIVRFEYQSSKQTVHPNPN